ncbi:hypothetical protein NZK33_12620 [Cyanobium sp. FGCU-6]|nr:hypothetical protein [Cyanobium sp. FGCU6]
MDLTPLDRTTHQLAATNTTDTTDTTEGAHPRALSVAAQAASASGPTAAERILAAEMAGRAEGSDALSMMVGSIARMVQAGKTRDSRWKAS